MTPQIRQIFGGITLEMHLILFLLNAQTILYDQYISFFLNLCTRNAWLYFWTNCVFLPQGLLRFSVVGINQEKPVIPPV